MNADTDRHIRVPEHVHKEIMARKQDDETVGEAVARLIGGYDLVDFAYDTQPTTGDPEERITDLESEYEGEAIGEESEAIRERAREDS